MRMMAPHFRPPGTLAFADRSRPAVRDMSRQRIPRNQKLRKYRTSAAVYMSGSIDETFFHNSSQSMLNTLNRVRNNRAPATKVTATVGSENTPRRSASPLNCLSGGFFTTGSPPLVASADACGARRAGGGTGPETVQSSASRREGLAEQRQVSPRPAGWRAPRQVDLPPTPIRRSPVRLTSPWPISRSRLRRRTAGSVRPVPAARPHPLIQPDRTARDSAASAPLPPPWR